VTSPHKGPNGIAIELGDTVSHWEYQCRKGGCLMKKVWLILPSRKSILPILILAITVTGVRSVFSAGIPRVFYREKKDPVKPNGQEIHSHTIYSDGPVREIYLRSGEAFSAAGSTRKQEYKLTIRSDGKWTLSGKLWQDNQVVRSLEFKEEGARADVTRQIEANLKHSRWRCKGIESNGREADRVCSRAEFEEAERIVGRKLLWPTEQPKTPQEFVRMLQGAWLTTVDTGIIIAGNTIIEGHFNRDIWAYSKVSKRNFRPITESSVEVEKPDGKGVEIWKIRFEIGDQLWINDWQAIRAGTIGKNFVGKWYYSKNDALIEFTNETSTNDVPWNKDKDMDTFYRKLFHPRILYLTTANSTARRKLSKKEWMLFPLMAIIGRGANMLPDFGQMALRYLGEDRLHRTMYALGYAPEKYGYWSEPIITQIGLNYQAKDSTGVLRTRCHELYKKIANKP